MDPYKPPTSKSGIKLARKSNTIKLKNKNHQRWIIIAGYFCAILGIGFVVSLLSSIFFHNAKLDMPSPNTTGFRAHLAIGSLGAALICPILAGIRYWNPFNYLIAAVLALGLLLTNIGSGIPLALLSVLILYGYNGFSSCYHISSHS